MSISIRKHLHYDTDLVSDETGLSCPEPTRTQQQFKKETDINEILRRFGKTGVVPQSIRPPTYGDFTGVDNYQDAANAIIQAQVAFDELPSSIRREFDNNPALFVDYCSDPANLPNLRKMGLAPERNPETAKAVSNVNSQNSSEGFTPKDNADSTSEAR
jgi:phage internal scaffolding protein